MSVRNRTIVCIDSLWIKDRERSIRKGLSTRGVTSRHIDGSLLINLADEHDILVHAAHRNYYHEGKL